MKYQSKFKIGEKVNFIKKVVVKFEGENVYVKKRIQGTVLNYDNTAYLVQLKSGNTQVVSENRLSLN